MGLPKMGAFDPTAAATLPVIQGRSEDRSSATGDGTFDSLIVNRLRVNAAINAPLMQSPGLAAGGINQVIPAGGGFTTLTNSPFTAVIPVQSQLLYLVYVTGFMTAAGPGNQCNIRGRIGGFDVTAQIILGASTIDSSFIWYYAGPGLGVSFPKGIPPGSYTLSMEASAVGSSFTVNQFFHQLFLLNQVAV